MDTQTSSPSEKLMSSLGAKLDSKMSIFRETKLGFLFFLTALHPTPRLCFGLLLFFYVGSL